MAGNRALKSVRVTNHATSDFSDLYDGVRFTVRAGSDNIVPFDAACLWLGDPQLIDVGAAPGDRHRTEELDRVQRRCGWIEGRVYDDPDGGQDGRKVSWEDHRPKLSVYDPDTGNEVPMVASAPDGPSVNLFSGESDGKAVDDKTRIAQLEAAVKALVASGKGDSVDRAIDQLASDGEIDYSAFPGADNPDAVPGTPTAEIPEDTPSRVRATKS